MKKTERFVFRLDSQERKILALAANYSGLSQSELMRGLLRDYVRRTILREARNGGADGEN